MPSLSFAWLKVWKKMRESSSTSEEIKRKKRKETRVSSSYLACLPDDKHS